MSQTLPDNTLRKILVQIQQTAINANRNLNLTKAQIAAKEREKRILQLTINEIGALDPEVNVYRGVGKMFLQVPRPEMDKSLKKQEKELSDDLDVLNKKGKYLEKEFNDAQGQLRDIVRFSELYPRIDGFGAARDPAVRKNGNDAQNCGGWLML